MEKFESGVKHVPYSQERVYQKLSDLSNLESVRDKLAEHADGLDFDSDSLTINMKGVTLVLRIIEREPCKCIKFEAEKSPIPINLWIQILSEADEQAKLKVTLGAELNMFMKGMVAKPMQEGVEKMAEMLSMLPY